MAGKSSVDTHPDREKIIAAIIKGEKSYRAIAKEYGLYQATISRFVKKMLIPQAAAAMAEREERHGKAVLDRIEDILIRMHRLYDACDEYLQDPKNPGKYDLYPRAWEIDVIYRTMNEKGKEVCRKEDLQSIIRRIEDSGYSQPELYVKSMDPRKLIIETARTIGSQLEIVAKIQGAIKEQMTTNITINQYWVELKELILGATKGYPAVRQAIVERLEHVIGNQTAV
jgi:hypothetical protein